MSKEAIKCEGLRSKPEATKTKAYVPAPGGLGQSSQYYVVLRTLGFCRLALGFDSAQARRSWTSTSSPDYTLELDRAAILAKGPLAVTPKVVHPQ
jgi:hypothetical protein